VSEWVLVVFFSPCYETPKTVIQKKRGRGKKKDASRASSGVLGARLPLPLQLGYSRLAKDF
jgi:hypothetical protein